ncbi:hypothetical protein JCM21900_006976 [Sporobolomyces salmonicolor]
MSALRTVSALAVVLFSVGGACAMFSDGTISDRDYSLSYTGYDDTLAFCTAFRAECINYVGALDAHHQLDCVTTQSGPRIYAFCGGKQKTANGDTGDGPTYDFTTEVCPATTGCTIATNPVSPTVQWSGSFPSATSAGSSSASSATSTEAPTTASVGTTTSAEELTSSVSTPTATTLATVAKIAKADDDTSSTASSVVSEDPSSSLEYAAAAVVSSASPSSSSTSSTSSTAASSSSIDAASSATFFVAKTGSVGIVVFIAGVVAIAM